MERSAPSLLGGPCIGAAQPLGYGAKSRLVLRPIYRKGWIGEGFRPSFKSAQSASNFLVKLGLSFDETLLAAWDETDNERDGHNGKYGNVFAIVGVKCGM
jgi:hypothetical protein